jgi:hypothetical protein
VSAQTCFDFSNKTLTSSGSERVYLYHHKFEIERTKLIQNIHNHNIRFRHVCGTIKKSCTEEKNRTDFILYLILRVCKNRNKC